MREPSQRSQRGNGGKLVLDTSFLIEPLDRGREELTNVLVPYEDVVVPWIALYEYLYGHKIGRGAKAEELRRRKKAVESLGRVVSMSQEHLLETLELDAELKRSGRPAPFSDILIAAVARCLSADVATMDREHFKNLGSRVVP